MSKKLIIILILLIIVIGGGGFVFKDKLFSLVNPTKELTRPLDEKEEIKFEWVEWQDPAGFSFEYPKELTINNHPEDEINYAHLELLENDRKGGIVILCNDSEYSDIDDWVENNELVKEGSSLETKVASLGARKVALGKGREIVGFIDWDEVIYTIDLQSEEEDYWQPIFNHILDSFKLIPLEGESEEEFVNWLEGFDTSEADVVEPVEIIE